MKINKIFLLAAMALTGMGFASCSDDDNFEPGKPAGSNNVYFVDEASQVLELTATSFTITVGRADAGSALSVPLTQVQVDPVFTVPATAEFAAGQTETEVTIQISAEAVPFTNYQLRLAIPEEYTSPYKVNEKGYVPEMNVNIMKEDYKPFQKGTYYSQFNDAEVHNNVLEYSEMKKTYRVKVVDEAMEHTFTFTIDANNKIHINEKQIYQGWDYSDEYGGVYAMQADDKESFYDESDGDKTYIFGFKYVLPKAGLSFTNSAYDYFVVEE